MLNKTQLTRRLESIYSELKDIDIEIGRGKGRGQKQAIIDMAQEMMKLTTILKEIVEGGI